MNPNVKNSSFRILMLITTPKLADKAARMYHKGSVSTYYQLNAAGTASSEMLDILGLGNSDKSILISMLPKPFADKMLEKLNQELKLDISGRGIAFTMPLSGANNLVLKMMKQIDSESNIPLERKDEVSMAEPKNVMIVSIVNQGYSEDVMSAARTGGAKGGTVIHSRRIADEQVVSFWGFNVQEEKEMVLIVSSSENKMPIMRAISEKCGMHSEARGIIISLPIDTVIGCPTV